MCDCSQTDEEYDYERSIDKVRDTIEKEKMQLHEAFVKSHRSCLFQDYWHDGKKRWEFRYDPFICATCKCEYCTALKQDMHSGIKGNVFYDLKITREGGGDGLLKREFDVTVEKGKRLFEKNISLSVAEIIAKSFKYKIQKKEEMRHHSELFFNEHHGVYFKLEVLNVRAERRVSRDLEQDLKDIAEGITVTHESDLIKDKKELKHLRRIESEQKRVNRALKTVFEKGLDNIDALNLRRLEKFERNGLLEWGAVEAADKKGKAQRQIQQLSLF